MKRKITINAAKQITLWYENGNVMQSGLFTLPEILISFNNSIAGEREAEAYMKGFEDCVQMIVVPF